MPFIFYSDYAAGVVRQVLPSAPGDTLTEYFAQYPGPLVVLSTGNLAVLSAMQQNGQLDFSWRQLQLFMADVSAASTVAPPPPSGLTSLRGICADSSDFIYVTNSVRTSSNVFGEILIYNSSLSYVRTLQEAHWDTTGLSMVSGIAVDAVSNIVLTSYYVGEPVVTLFANGSLTGQLSAESDHGTLTVAELSMTAQSAPTTLMRDAFYNSLELLDTPTSLSSPIYQLLGTAATMYVAPSTQRLFITHGFGDAFGALTFDGRTGVMVSMASPCLAFDDGSPCEVMSDGQGNVRFYQGETFTTTDGSGHFLSNFTFLTGGCSFDATGAIYHPIAYTVIGRYVWSNGFLQAPILAGEYQTSLSNAVFSNTAVNVFSNVLYALDWTRLVAFNVSTFTEMGWFAAPAPYSYITDIAVDQAGGSSIYLIVSTDPSYSATTDSRVLRYTDLSGSPVQTFKLDEYPTLIRALAVGQFGLYLADSRSRVFLFPALSPSLSSSGSSSTQYASSTALSSTSAQSGSSDAGSSAQHSSSTGGTSTVSVEVTGLSTRSGSLLAGSSGTSPVSSANQRQANFASPSSSSTTAIFVSALLLLSSCCYSSWTAAW